MASQSISDIYAAARAAGFSPQQASTWTAIALAESGGNPGALNDHGEHSMGLWQINVAPGVRTNRWGDLNDPQVNARAAFEISGHGKDMRPWTTTHDRNKGTAHDYRTYLDQVERVTGVKGDPRGVHGYGAPLPPPLPEEQVGASLASTHNQIDPAAAPRAALDADHDGLTDEFERPLGTDPTVADSDLDGIPDGVEVVHSHTDPRAADTDHDGLSDSAELALGTKPKGMDSDADGMTDAAEAMLHTDPMVADPRIGALPPSHAPAVTPTGLAAASLSAARPPQPSSQADAFVAEALGQQGDRYVYGAETKLEDSNPTTFDCSELTQWAAHRVGVTIPDGAAYQYLDLKEKGALVPVDQALKTKGALLFYFSREPKGGGLPAGQAHVAISLGDGRTIEARGRTYGVGQFEAGHRFNYAGIIPEMSAPAPTDAFLATPTTTDAVVATGGARYDVIDAGHPVDRTHDSDSDGLVDEFEKLLGTDPTARDTDSDGTEDATEYATHTDPGHAPGTSAAAAAAKFPEYEHAAGLDSDTDGLSDTYEILAGLDPNLGDTDRDGLSDSMEVQLGLDPLSVDTDHDGISDGLQLSMGSDPLAPGATPVLPADTGQHTGDDGPHLVGQPATLDGLGPH